MFKGFKRGTRSSGNISMIFLAIKGNNVAENNNTRMDYSKRITFPNQKNRVIKTYSATRLIIKKENIE